MTVKLCIRCLLRIQQRELVAATLREKPDIYRKALGSEKAFKHFEKRHGYPTPPECPYLKQLRDRARELLEADTTTHDR